MPVLAAEPNVLPPDLFAGEPPPAASERVSAAITVVRPNRNRPVTLMV